MLCAGGSKGCGGVSVNQIVTGSQSAENSLVRKPKGCPRQAIPRRHEKFGTGRYSEPGNAKENRQPLARSLQGVRPGFALMQVG